MLEWQKKRTLKRAKKQFTNIQAKHSNMLEEVMNYLGNAIGDEPNKTQLHIVMVICSNLICGFDNKEQREVIVKMIANTVQSYNELEKQD